MNGKGFCKTEDATYSTIPRRGKSKSVFVEPREDEIFGAEALANYRKALSRSSGDLTTLSTSSLVDRSVLEIAGNQASFTCVVKQKRKEVALEIEEISQDIKDKVSQQTQEVKARYYYDLNRKMAPLQEAFKSGKKKFDSEGTAEAVMHFIDKALINETAEDVALCLFKEGFSRDAIGLYLGKRELNPLHQRVLEQYIQFVDVRRLDLVEAVREFGKIITFPDNPYAVESIMTEFGKYYHRSNPKKFDSADTCSACAVSLVLLNSNLHGQNSYQRIPVKEYLQMHEEFSAELSQDTLRAFYDAVSQAPIQIQVRSRQKQVEHKGILDIEDTRPNKWKKGYYCQLFSDGCMHFSKQGRRSSTKFISLAGVSVRRMQLTDDRQNQKFMFELYPVDLDSEGVRIGRFNDKRPSETRPKGVRFRVGTSEERDQWMHKIHAQLKRMERRERESLCASFIGDETILLSL